MQIPHKVLESVAQQPRLRSADEFGYRFLSFGVATKFRRWFDFDDEDRRAVDIDEQKKDGVRRVA